MRRRRSRVPGLLILLACILAASFIIAYLADLEHERARDSYSPVFPLPTITVQVIPFQPTTAFTATPTATPAPSHTPTLPTVTPIVVQGQGLGGLIQVTLGGVITNAGRITQQGK
jgi:hypothetical protein